VKALLHLVRSIVQIYFREPLTVFLSIGLLTFMMLLFGTIAGTDGSDLRFPVALLDQSMGRSKMVQDLHADQLLAIQPVEQESQINELIRHGRAIAGVIVLPTNGAASSKDNGFRIVAGRTIGNHLTAMAVSHLASVLTPDHQPTVAFTDGPVLSQRFIDFIFPGVLALAILQTCLSSAVVLLDAQKNGIIRRMRVTPVRQYQIYGGFLLGRTLIVVLQLIILALIGILGFRVHIVSSLYSLAFVVFLGTMTFMAMAGVIALYSHSVEAGVLTTQLLSFPMAFLSGVFFRNENVPRGILWLVKILPLTYLTDLMRGTIMLGLPLKEFSVDITVLSSWFVALSGLLLFGSRSIARE
jgi:ABC-2 type transport system permease protein